MSIPFHRNHRSRSRPAFAGGPVIAAICAALGLSLTAAVAGPCTGQIAQLEHQVTLLAPADPQIGPSAPQSVGAQLHRQPTPGTVERAEGQANAEADAVLERARKADAENNAEGCNEALREAKRLYGID